MTLKEMVKHKGNGETSSNLPARHEDVPQTSSIYNEMMQWMDQWNRRFDSLFGRAFDPSFYSGQALTPFKGIHPQWSDWAGQARLGSFVPAVNVDETDTGYSVTAELPGMDEKDVEVSLNKGTLLIKGEKKEESEDKGKGYYRTERSYGTFQRTIPLPHEVDADKVEATFKKDVLTVNLPKLPAEQTGATKIDIKAGEK